MTIYLQQHVDASGFGTFALQLHPHPHPPALEEQQPLFAASSGATGFDLGLSAQQLFVSVGEDVAECSVCAFDFAFLSCGSSEHIHSPPKWQLQGLSNGPNSTAQIFKVTPHDLPIQGKGLEQLHEVTFNNTHLGEIPVSAPNKMIKSVRTQAACFEPTALSKDDADTPIRRVLGIQGPNVYMYDIPTAKVIGHEKLGVDTLNKLSYSPHAPFGSLLATCSQDSTISILDTRTMQPGNTCVVWSQPDAHNGDVMDVSFNNFIPYWLASSGEDGVVKFWDIRYLKGPAGRIDGHYGSIPSIAWSNTHCDMLASASLDRSCRVWSFSPNKATAKKPWKEFMVGFPGSEFENINQPNLEDHLIVGSTMIGEFTEYTSPVIAVAAASLHADTYYTITATGTISSHLIRSKMFEQLLTHKYENTFEFQVELGIHTRQLNDAYEAMINLSRNEYPKDKNLKKHEKDLIDLCSIPKPIPESAWGIAEFNELDMLKIKNDLIKYSYGLPPRFDAYPQWHSVISTFTQLQYDLAVLRHKICTGLEEGNWEVILKHEEEFMVGMEVDHEFIDVETIELVLKTLLVNKFKKGLTMGLGLGQLLADVPKYRWESLAELMSLMIFPTIFEQSDWLPDKDTDLMKNVSLVRQDTLERYLQHVKDENTKGNMDVRSSKLVKADDDRAAKKVIATTLGESKQALPMVSLELRMLKLIENPPEEYNEEIIRIMQNVLTDSGVAGRKGNLVPFEKTFSANSNMMYLKALLETKRFEEYFGVAINIMITAYPFDFSRTVLRQIDREGIVGAKAYVESMYASAMTNLNGVSSVPPLVAGIKFLKEAAAMVVKMTAHMMEGLDAFKQDKDCIDTLTKVTTILSGLMQQLSPSILKAFESMEKIQKSMLKEYALLVHDAIRVSQRAFPLRDNKPRNVAEKAAYGLIVQDEAQAIVEKLYRNYIKGESFSQ
ncbi:hypothetical protein HK103_005174 [Boothiomyces macroporosus]|uniref:Uncharacterized protein n=1 Tax=Boothiomyces macroporosus TaxID=261099 RepID=A0AAD5UJQ1_9FUNG|nr:hypothetical protein HK103_005174 [Boothiomyces macroporosus]